VYACKKKETQWTFFEKKKKIMWSWRQKNNHWHHWRRRILIIKCEEPCRRRSSNMILLLIVIFFSYEHYTITDICKKLNTRHIGALSLCFEGFKQNKTTTTYKSELKNLKKLMSVDFSQHSRWTQEKSQPFFPLKKSSFKKHKTTTILHLCHHSMSKLLIFWVF